MSKEKNASSGFGLGTILFLIFLTLKLAEIGPVQYWSWWAITCPLWIPLLLVVGIAAIIGLVVWIGHSLNR